MAPFGIILWSINSLLALDCPCNQLLGRPENIEDRGQALMHHFHNVHWQLKGVVKSIIFFKLTSDSYFFSPENEGWVLPTEIRAKQDNLFGINCSTVHMELMVSSQHFWSGSINNKYLESTISTTAILYRYGIKLCFTIEKKVLYDSVISMIKLMVYYFVAVECCIIWGYI